MRHITALKLWSYVNHPTEPDPNDDVHLSDCKFCLKILRLCVLCEKFEDLNAELNDLTQRLAGEERSTPHNGETNEEFGIYRSLCCTEEIVISEGAVFPDCPRHPDLTTTWKLITEERIPQRAISANERA
jgi:hypothetical protein